MCRQYKQKNSLQGFTSVVQTERHSEIRSKLKAEFHTPRISSTGRIIFPQKTEIYLQNSKVSYRGTASKCESSRAEIEAGEGGHTGLSSPYSM